MALVFSALIFFVKNEVLEKLQFINICSFKT